MSSNRDEAAFASYHKACCRTASAPRRQNPIHLASASAALKQTQGAAEADARWMGFCRSSFGTELPRAATLKDNNRTLYLVPAVPALHTRTRPSPAPFGRPTSCLPASHILPAPRGPVGLIVLTSFRTSERAARLRRALLNSWLLAGYPRKQACAVFVARHKDVFVLRNRDACTAHQAGPEHRIHHAGGSAGFRTRSSKYGGGAEQSAVAGVACLLACAAAIPEGPGVYKTHTSASTSASPCLR